MKIFDRLVKNSLSHQNPQNSKHSTHCNQNMDLQAMATLVKLLLRINGHRNWYVYSPLGEVFGKITMKEEESRLEESKKHQAARLGEHYNQFMIHKKYDNLGQTRQKQPMPLKPQKFQTYLVNLLQLIAIILIVNLK